ncbi:uncharacterized protein LOC131215511 [Anopheles bellator]|uniref:uncharacterized protein LOC131215511 n=1 Tax=Anopheles bellator TaxID=139047 RepID=UPI00264906E9|nr:uncharacterized protein LOC131215511 [Anopheles bellator]
MAPGSVMVMMGLLMMGVTAGRSPMLPLGKEAPRTLQMIGAASPRMLHRISADLKPDASQVVHIQVPYYIERPKRTKKKFQPWPLRGQRFASLPSFPKSLPSAPISFGLHTESAFKQHLGVNPGPYDTPFVPVMKPSPVNPLHREPPPEIMFEPISILPLETPSFDTLRNHVNFLKHKQAAFFEGRGREFGFGGGEGTPPAPIPDELDYFGEHERQLGEVHKGDAGGSADAGEQNTLSEDDFGQNDRKYDRRGVPVGRESDDESSAEDDFYDTEERQQQPYAPDEDFEDSREESDRAAAFEPKKVYTQVRHQETTRHVRPADPDDGDGDDEDNDEDQSDREERTADEESDEPDSENEEARPIRERVKEARKNIVYSEQGHQASKFDHGSAESYGQFEQQKQDAGPARRKRKRPRIKRSVEESANAAAATSGEMDEVAIILLTGNESLPLAEALTDPRELHGDELIRFLDEAIANTTQYLPEAHLDNPEVINIVAPPSNVVKFPYYNRPVSEIDVDSALRYAENLTTFSGGGPYGNRGDVECNEVDVNIADEPEPTGPDGDGEGDGFRPIKRLQGLGGKIECLKVRHFGQEPLDNPLFREEFVGGWPRKSLRPAGPQTPGVPSRQPNPAVAVYNDVIRHIKKHLASQQQRKKNAKPDEPDTLMIAVPRVLRLPAAEAAQEATQAAVGVKPAHKREAKILAFPQANPTGILSNHVSIPIFDISKYFPRFMMRANDDLYADEPDTKVRQGRLSTPKPRTPTKATHLRTLVRTAEQLAEGAVEVEESVERQRATTGQPGRDDIADAFDDVIGKPLSATLKPLPPLKPYDVVEDTRDTGPEPTYNKSGPPYSALALEPPVAQSILSQRLEPVKRNQLDFLKAKRSAKKPTTATVHKRPRPGLTRKKVLVFYHR